MPACGSCGRNDFNFVEFACPSLSCTDGKVIRCKTCRENENKYTCPSCGFTGP